MNRSQQHLSQTAAVKKQRLTLTVYSRLGLNNIGKTDIEIMFFCEIYCDMEKNHQMSYIRK